MFINNVKLVRDMFPWEMNLIFHVCTDVHLSDITLFYLRDPNGYSPLFLDPILVS